MKYLESFEKFTNPQISNLMESLNVWHDILLASIGAEKVDVFDELKLGDSFKDKMDIEFLSKSSEFVNSLGSIGLKKSPIENTDDYETFVNKPCKFLLIHDHDSNELENPQYILFQTWNDGLKEWDTSQLYKLKSGIGGFYDKLSSKTIEIIDGDDNYIYSTSNGNDWELQNNKEDDTYKKSFRRDDFQKLIDSKKSEIKLNII